MSVRYSNKLCLLLLLFLGCAKSKETPVLIDPEFQTYVDRFVAEAVARNVTVDISTLKAEFVTQVLINGFPYCGQSVAGNTPHIQISNNSCWEGQTDSNREILIFHELGHALLKRSHDNAKLANGGMKTMMFEGNQFNLYTKFTPQLRKYYIDELFNQATNPPSWAAAKSNSVTMLDDSISFPTDWKFVKGLDLAHVNSVSSVKFNSGGHSLSISSPSAGSGSKFSYWYKVIPATTSIGAGSEMWVRLKLRMENVTGSGIQIALRGDFKNEGAFFTTTANKIVINGNSDFADYYVHLPYYPEQTDSILIFLIMIGDATGTVYFDDIRLINEF